MKHNYISPFVSLSLCKALFDHWVQGCVHYNKENHCKCMHMYSAQITYKDYWMPMYSFSASGPCSVSGEVLTNSSGIISSPGYKADGTGAYGLNADCRWMIEAPEGNVRK